MEKQQLAVHCENLIKLYKTKDFEVMALQGLDLEIEAGELLAIIGSSGSGKSTLLNILGGLDRPTAGQLSIDGRDMLTVTDREMILYKRESVGFVWQNSARNLVPFLTAQDNVELPMILSTASGRSLRAVELLELVGLASKRKNKVYELSGGEQQRVAIAIALANNPRLMLADEPTGAVDTHTAGVIMDIFRQLQDQGHTVIIVTHDLAISRSVDRVVAIRDGRTSSEFVRRSSYAEALDTVGDLRIAPEKDEHEELLVLDKAGRVQLPGDFLQSLGIVGGKDKVTAELADDRIMLIKRKSTETPENKQ